MIMGAEPSIPVRFVPEAPAPHFRAGLSVSSNQEKHHPATADIPELLDTSIRLHEMPGTVIENTDNRHEMATPDVVMTPNRLETPDFGDIELDFRSIDGESDMGERRPTSWL
ncbi:hypothetical protein QBC35DRAFT_505414 [Podospora australis]|uniref:Uncharacterized protein n=1 Tax=Podospora australis TaxID=1536484 RepID=A0AAN7AG93_9PEZI|nr:hypothetical protein QBC35DRAFT_505414 [Podospora australis]